MCWASFEAAHSPNKLPVIRCGRIYLMSPERQKQGEKSSEASLLPVTLIVSSVSQLKEADELINISSRLLFFYLDVGGRAVRKTLFKEILMNNEPETR